MRKAAANSAIALLRFLFLTGWPPPLGTRGANVVWETNSFSLGQAAQIRTIFADRHLDRFHPDRIDYLMSTPFIRHESAPVRDFGSACTRTLI